MELNGNKKNGGFSLVDHLVVCAILGGLAAVIYPVARGNRSQDDCLGKFKELGRAQALYCQDNNDTFVPRVTQSMTGDVSYDAPLTAYAKDMRMWSCDAANPRHSDRTRSMGMNRALATSYDGSYQNPRPVKSSVVVDPASTILMSEDVPTRPYVLTPRLTRHLTTPDARIACLSFAQVRSAVPLNSIGKALTRHAGKGNYGRVDGSAASLAPEQTLEPKVRWFAGSPDTGPYTGTEGLTMSTCNAIGANQPFLGTDPVTGN